MLKPMHARETPDPTNATILQLYNIPSMHNNGPTNKNTDKSIDLQLLTLNTNWVKLTSSRAFIKMMAFLWEGLISEFIYIN